jgi:hypothetical protein
MPLHQILRLTKDGSEGAVTNAEKRYASLGKKPDVLRYASVVSQLDMEGGHHVCPTSAWLGRLASTRAAAHVFATLHMSILPPRHCLVSLQEQVGKEQKILHEAFLQRQVSQ